MGNAKKFTFHSQHDKDMVLMLLHGSREGLVRNAGAALAKIGVTNTVIVRAVGGFADSTLRAVADVVASAPVKGCEE